MRISASVLPSLIAAFILAACGGDGDNNKTKNGNDANSGGMAGGSSTSTSSSSNPEGPTGNSGTDSGSDSTIYTAVAPSQGDTLVYAQTVNIPGNALPITAALTRYFKTVNPDGSSVFTLTSSSPDRVGTSVALDSNGAQVSHVVHGGESCTFSPSFIGAIGPTPGVERVAGPYSVGTTWNYTSVASCMDNGTSYDIDVTNAGSIVGREQISVQGVSFKTVKEVYSVTASARPSGSSNTRKVDYTCWRDTVLGRIVRCNVSSNIIPPNSTTPSVEYTATLDLWTYMLKGASGSTAVPPLNGPLLGGWTLTFSGTTNGTCSITVSGGDVTGSCTTASGTFTFSGKVSNGGQITFGVPLQPGTLGTFSGNLQNPLEGSGTWTDDGGGSGTWSSTHN